MTWNADALARLGANAIAFGKAYVALKDAMVREGVSQTEAREEARSVATMAAMWDEEAEGGDCPVCGGSGEL